MREPQVRKEVDVTRLGSVRFDGEFAVRERADAARTLRSAGASVTSWSVAAKSTYAGLALDADADIEAIRAAVAALAVGAGAIICAPPHVMVRVTPDFARRLDALEEALGGSGRPAGISDVRREPSAAALVVEFDPRETPLALVVATIDYELATAPGRTIEPLVALDDETLAAYAGALLGEPDLAASRLIETYLEPLLAEARA